ncbi:MAG: histidine kinase [Clostridia bacterium]
MITIIVLMTIASPIIAYFSLFSPITDLIVEEYARALDSSMNDVAHLTNTALNSIKYLSQDIYSQASYIDLLRHGTTYQNNDVYNSLLTSLYMISANNRYISALRFYFTRDRHLITFKGSTTEGSFYTQTEETTRFEKSTGMYMLVPLQTIQTYDENQPLFTSIQRITNFPRDDLLGVFAADISSDVLDELFEDTNLYNLETLCLLDQNHELLYLKGNRQLSSEFFSQLLTQLDYQNTAVSNLHLDGKSYLVCIRKLDHHAAYALRFVPSASLMQRASQLLKQTLVIYLLLSAALLVLGMSLSSQAMQPIKALAEHMRQLESGHLGEHMEETPGYDEFNLLAHRFNAMSNEIEKLIRETYLLRLSQQAAELKALRAQINPHFIFNTLQSIHYLALEHNAYEINMVVDSLSSILHYSLREEKNNVPLREEVRIVQEYLIIQQVRFIDRLCIHMDVASETLDLLLPQMILQPLVENSVLHGMKNSMAQCTVSLCSRSTAEAFFVEIKDNGIGIEPHKLHELRNALKSCVTEPICGNHIGIRNCWMRLNYLYPGAVTMNLESEPGIGTQIQIQISRKEATFFHEMPDC